MRVTNKLKKRRIIAALISLSLISVTILMSACETAISKGSMKKPSSLKSLSYEAAPITGYKTHADGGVIYNPLSKEAEKTGVLNKYKNVSKKKATVKTSGIEVEYSMPTDITAYDVIPVDYKVTFSEGAGFPVTLEANAFEEKGRGTDKMYDLAVPGNMDMKFEYLGYVTGTFDGDKRNVMTPDNSDTPAKAYPNYTTTNLTKSGTVEAGDIVWLKFKYTNTGDTILDPEGIGGFSIYPKLYKKSNLGQYELVGGLYNEYVRELTYVYPGETREFWVNFVTTAGEDVGKTPQDLGLTEGNYKVEFTTFYRTEYNYEPYTNIWQGRKMQVAEMTFDAAKTKKDSTPAEIRYQFTNGGNSKNQASWVHYFEEFMTTYEQFRSKPSENVVEGTLYLQVAPFTEQVVLKLIHSDPKRISIAKIPVKVNTDDVGLVYDSDNINTVINSDGYEVPAVYTQPMSDMRANVQVSPYPQETIVNDLLNMKECGVNLLTTTGMPWLYDCIQSKYMPGQEESGISNTFSDAIRYTLDLARQLDFKMEGIGSYPMGRLTISDISKWISGENYYISKASPGEADYGDPDVSKANAVAYLYQRSRWGDLYWSDKFGVSSYTSEDTRGFMRYEAHVRYAMGEQAKDKFRAWLEKKYKTVDAMNAVWKTSYKTFTSVDPEKGQKKDETNFGTWYTYINKESGFYEWSPAVIDLDSFRTELRITNYEEMLTDIRQTDKDAKIQIRTEGSNFVVPGLDPKEDNDHFRSIIYQQLRGATIAEQMVVSDAFRSYADYTTLPLTPSEVRTVVKKSVENGIIPMVMPQFDNMRDIVINDKYGDDYTVNYNLTTPKKGALIHTLTAVFPWWKATYEEGGIPGILWQDFQCDGFATETQMKEMKFFKQKVEKMLSDPAVKKQAKAKAPAPEIKKGKNTYDTGFIKKMISEAQDKRKD